MTRLTIALLGIGWALLAGCPRPVEVEEVFRLDVGGAGSGVLNSTPAGINCALSQGASTGSCFATFNEGTPITLSASAAIDWEFLNWTGAGCGTAPVCQFSISQNTVVSAGFDRAGGPGLMKLTLAGAPAGTAALILAVSGGTITGVTAAPGYQIRTSPVNQGSIRILVRGNLSNGVLADLQVSDRKAAFAVAATAATAGASGGYALLGIGSIQGMIARP